MAAKLSQEEVLDFLCQGGGKVPNAALVAHFKHFLRDPRAAADQLLKSRERFKRYVNSVAVVKQEGAVKYVVLRSRYRDLLGEDLTPAIPGEVEPQDEPAIGNNREDDELGSSLLHGAQVGGGWSRHNEGNGYDYHRSEPVTDRYQQQGSAITLNGPGWTGNANGTFDGKIRHGHSYSEPCSHDPETQRLQQPLSQSPFSSAYSSVPTDHGSTSPPSKTSSPVNNTYLPSRNSFPHDSHEVLLSNRIVSQESSDTSMSTMKISSPSKTSIPFDKTSSPSNNSVPFDKTSSPSTSIPFVRTSSSPSNVSTKTSEAPSNTSSPQSKDYYPADNLSAPYSKESSFCSSETPSLHQLPFPDASEHWRPLPGDDHRTETNPAFVSVSCGGQQEQKLACTEIQTPHFGFSGACLQEAYSEQEDNSNYIREQQGHGFHEELTASPPSRYMHCTHPSSSLLLPHESSINPVDVQLEDYQPASLCPSPPLPLNDMHDMWMCQMPVFKSIRCQLSLQDMEDFVDQESCGSEGSDSGEGGDCDTEHKDDDFSSDSNTDKYAQYIEQKCENTRRCPPNRKFLSIIEQYNQLQSGDLLEAKNTLVVCEPESSAAAETRKSPYFAKSFLTDQAPILFELAKQPPKHRASSRFQELMSSSDDELIDRDFRRKRRSSRAKRPPGIILVPPHPDGDLLLTAKPVSYNKFVVNLADQKEYQAQNVPKANVDFLLKKSFTYKSSTVPLDPAEHDWIVKSASGSWLQVYGLFSQDPQLALRKDFISGYTALHWFAKHGAIEMFHKFVAGAKKAGVELDLNIKSNGGYTPLHIAAIHGHQKVAAMLVENLKVNVKLRDNSGKRAWQYLSCNTSGEVWQLLGAPRGKTIFASRTLNTTYLNTHNKLSQINRKTSLAAFLKPQHQKWKANNHPVLREREIYSD
ncbi:PREDICTED: ankyrin repeat domain-containing protein SOWAHB [Nanorana parkeri]|uniref:ankyrin repeat domain-containing protein SOWAHB n=1 Tax=Nanorana parkeri TaxID=125878 RepID=UPI000854158E|nr:PREDICTED: ankyrin repeat domain-containing protein SOWAHB [Nanorana parkeri]